MKGVLIDPVLFKKETLDINARSAMFCTTTSLVVKLIIAVLVCMQGIN
jgi:hypothetical protein